MASRKRTYDELLDATQVAALMGLSGTAAVSVYSARYDDFPEPVVIRNMGRCRLYHHADIEAFLRRHPRIGRKARGRDT